MKSKFIRLKIICQNLNILDAFLQIFIIFLFVLFSGDKIAKLFIVSFLILLSIKNIVLKNKTTAPIFTIFTNSIIILFVGFFSLENKFSTAAIVEQSLILICILLNFVFSNLLNTIRPVCINLHKNDDFFYFPKLIPESILIILAISAISIYEILHKVERFPFFALLFTFIKVIRIIIVNKKFHNSQNKLTKNIEKANIKFLIYWYTGVDNSLYHLEMWMEYLEKINRNFILLVRGSGVDLNLVAKKFPNLKIISVKKIDESVSALNAKTLSTVFYIANAAINMNGTRHTNLHHIQLNHGDSDKASSATASFRIYDKNFVAGKAAVDRFKNNNVKAWPEFFEIVGRPQVSKIKIGTSKKSKKRILYAPTWIGLTSDMKYSSLKNGIKIIKSILDNNNDVIFRPHPASYSNPYEVQYITEIDKLLAKNDQKYDSKKTKNMTINECFNLSDAMVCDNSSVITDYLFSEKPIGVFSNLKDTKKFINQNKIAKSIYVLKNDLSNIDVIIGNLTENDNKRNVRLKAKKYYLGNFSNKNYEMNFVLKARKYVDNPKK